MYVHFDRKVAFHACPRTGSRSIEQVFMSSGGYRIGSHHYSGKIQPSEGWTVFCVVRPHREVVASLLPLKVHVLESQGYMTHRAWQIALDDFEQEHCTNGELYWRTRICTDVLMYPCKKVPILNVSPEVVGKTGRGANWREVLPEWVQDKVENNKKWREEWQDITAIARSSGS